MDRVVTLLLIIIICWRFVICIYMSVFRYMYLHVCIGDKNGGIVGTLRLEFLPSLVESDLDFGVTPDNALGTRMNGNALFGQKNTEYRLVLPVVLSGGPFWSNAVQFQRTVLPWHEDGVVDGIISNIDQHDASRPHRGVPVLVHVLGEIQFLRRLFPGPKAEGSLALGGIDPMLLGILYVRGKWILYGAHVGDTEPGIQPIHKRRVVVVATILVVVVGFCRRHYFLSLLPNHLLDNCWLPRIFPRMPYSKIEVAWVGGKVKGSVFQEGIVLLFMWWFTHAEQVLRLVTDLWVDVQVVEEDSDTVGKRRIADHTFPKGLEKVLQRF